jgi:hypothetical protein
MTQFAEHRVAVPGFLERCCGFTIPESGVFYAFYFDEDLAQYDIFNRRAVRIDEGWEIDEQSSTISIGNAAHPFLGLWGGSPLSFRDGLGTLSLANSLVQLTTPTGETKSWQFQNFSGDWEHVTFDRNANGFLFGAPYDFDFRYVEL